MVYYITAKYLFNLISFYQTKKTLLLYYSYAITPTQSHRTYLMTNNSQKVKKKLNLIAT